MSTTHCVRAVVLALAASLLLGCPRPKPPLDNAKMSGFLEDYTVLRPGRAGQAAWVYWNEDAHWRSLTKITFEPVSIWRAGGGSLDAVVERDLMALASELQNIVEARLGKDYQIVKQAGPGVMGIGLAITQADADDTELDVFTSDIDEKDLPADDERLAVATKAFLDAAVLEGEIIDTGTGTLLAAAVDIWVADRQQRTKPASWGEVRAAFRGLADRLATVLARRTAG